MPISGFFKCIYSFNSNQKFSEGIKLNRFSNDYHCLMQDPFNKAHFLVKCFLNKKMLIAGEELYMYNSMNFFGYLGPLLPYDIIRHRRRSFNTRNNIAMNV